MLDYISTLAFESESTEGVTFEIHKPSTARNIEFNRLNATFREKARALRSEIDQNTRKLDEHARLWAREQDARYAKAKAAPDSEGAAGIIAGYEAEQELAKMRQQLQSYDLQALAGRGEEDEELKEVRALIGRMEETARVATSYVEPDDLAEERQWLTRQSELLMDEYYRPARVKWGVASIKGITINGKPATVESQVQFGPPDLTAEMFHKVEEVSRFSPEKLKKSSLPTISSAAAVGSESTTTASDVSKASSTSPATAKSISLS